MSEDPAPALSQPPVPLSGADRSAAILDAVTDAIFVVDAATGQVIELNRAVCRMLGRPRDELLGADAVATLAQGLDPGAADLAHEQLARAAGSGEAGRLELQCRTASDTRFWAEMTLSPTHIDRRPAVICVLRDITERRELTERFRQIAENISEVFWMTNPDGTEISYVSPGYETVWGRSCRALYQDPAQWLEAIHEADRARVAASLRRRGRSRLEQEYRIVRPDEEVRWISERTFPVSDANGEVHSVIGVANDITRQKRWAERIEHMAHHDTLTGLANRAAFTGALERAIARYRHSGRLFALMSLDLDRFKDVNDTQGHPVGDRLLRLAAERLQSGIRANDLVARFGGDEFAILLDDPAGPAEVAAVARRIIEALSAPYLLDGGETRVGASIGVAVAGPDGGDAETLLRTADLALYRAKADGRGTYCFFSEATEPATHPRHPSAAAPGAAAAEMSA